ncbi:hypothetical protein BSZ35_14855 [Salinibacter sp. 10B]|uniref:mechanosensitive ion channel family protein n=1 Tax=Salinibacter sp. 10B TaxID=1923971 RepID=UPI000CF50370|nr:mechanosensitive ion channel domain-containing protein [Salinibacter sp. 10B]PQJ35701.1 hypothetical protein BSZ35_14855 [Salinibacter sp. 10B]
MVLARLLYSGLLAGLLLVGPASAQEQPPSPQQPSPNAATLDAASSDTATTTAAPLGAQDPTLREVGETARSFGLRALGAVLVLVLTFFVINGVAFILETLAERNAERRLLYKRLVPIFRVLLWGIALYVVLRGIFDVDAQGLFAAAAAIGVAIGFAAQDLLKNIFGGLVILFDQSFQVGDKILVGGTYGEVTSIGLRSTRIVTPDDNLVTVPNAQVADGQVSNANAGELNCQVGTDLYLPGWVDEGRAKDIAYQSAVSSPYVYLEKPVVVLVKDEYDEGHLVHLKVKAYVIDTRYEALLASDITERARRAYRAEDLLPPMSHSHFGSSPSSPTPTGPPPAS